MKVKLENIKISKKRTRTELGDISVLMKSMTKHGLLQPIIIGEDFTLIAGYRRYIAARKLNWQDIDAKIVPANDKISKLEIEIDENTARKDFTFDEISNAIDRRDKLNRPTLIELFIKFIKRLFRTK